MHPTLSGNVFCGIEKLGPAPEFRARVPAPAHAAAVAGQLQVDPVRVGLVNEVAEALGLRGIALDTRHRDEGDGPHVRHHLGGSFKREECEACAAS